MIDLRDPQGKLLARYDPAGRWLHIARRGETSSFDLAALDRQAATTTQSAQSAVAPPATPASGSTAHDRRDPTADH
ncbi:MAG: hypothetical protein OHK0022_27980 [Roseiflexaceae bacterium]